MGSSDTQPAKGTQLQASLGLETGPGPFWIKV